MTLASKGVDGRRIVFADSALLCVEANTLANVRVASTAPDIESEMGQQKHQSAEDIRHFESGDKDTLVNLASPYAECMFAMDRLNEI